MFIALQHGARGGEQGPRFIFPFLFLLLAGFLIAKIIRRRRGGDGRGAWHHHGSPIQTLNDRFARGEIDRDEFEHRKAVLEGADIVPPAPPRQAPPAPPASSAAATATMVADDVDVDPATVIDDESAQADDEE